MAQAKPLPPEPIQPPRSLLKRPGDAPASAPSAGPEASHWLLTRLRGLFEQAQHSPQDLERLIKRFERLFARLEREQQRAAGTIQVGGGVGPGAAVGGAVHNRDVAGGSIYKAQNIYIMQAPATDAAAPPVEAVQGQALSSVERTYLNRLAQQVSRVPLARIEGGAALPADVLEMRLEALYVPLTGVGLPAGAAQQMEQSALMGSPGPAAAALARHRRLLLLGDPGAGKTTLLNFLTYALARARLYGRPSELERLNEGDIQWPHGALLPVRVDLRAFAASLPPEAEAGAAIHLWMHITDQLRAADLAEFTQDLHHRLHEGQVLLMLDGLDEITQRGRRAAVTSALIDFADTFAHNRIIVTCRALSYAEDGWHLPGFQAFKLAPLSPRSIALFIHQWYRTLGRKTGRSPHWVEARAAGLQAEAQALPELACSPLLLTAMALIHTDQGALPRRRAHLYQVCTDLLLRGWRLAADSDAPPQRAQLVAGLAQAAFNAQKKGSPHIVKSDLLKVLAKHLGGWAAAEELCTQVEAQAGLLIARGLAADEEIYAFLHRGFEEFLAARHLITVGDFAREALRLAKEGESWRQVVLLAAEQLAASPDGSPRVIDAADRLCAHHTPKTEPDWRAAWWAGELLALLGSAAEEDEIGAQALPRIRERLAALLHGGHLAPAQRSAAADALAALGDPRPGVADAYPLLISLKPLGVSTALGKYPVTNGQFRRFVAEGGYERAVWWSVEGQRWLATAAAPMGLLDHPWAGLPNRPVSGLSFYEAEAYCTWLTAKTGRLHRLPYPAEWEAAALRLPPPSHDQAANTQESGLDHAAAVGLFPTDRSAEGLCDLRGGVWGWASSPGVLLGGCFKNPLPGPGGLRHHLPPEAQVPFAGFRVAADEV